MDLNTLIIKTLCHGTDPRKSMFEGIPAEDMHLAILVAFAILILLIVLAAVIISFL